MKESGLPHMNIIPYLDFHPKISEDPASKRWVSIIGRTTIAGHCHFEDLVTLRADGNTITVGSKCWFGEYSTVHIADGTYGAILGNHVTIGRFSLVHGCTIAEDCLLGEHAVVMDNAIVGKGSVICSDSVVPPGKQLEPGWLYQGVPAKPIRKIEATELEKLRVIIKSRKHGAGAEWVLSKQPVAPITHEPGQGVAENSSDEFYIAPTAAIVGTLEMAAESSIWFGVEIAAKDASVSIGAASNVQDNSRITLDYGEHLEIGERVTIGHNVQLNACDLGDTCVIGMGSTIGKGTIVQSGGVVAAGAVTAPNTVITEGMIWSGNPAKQSRTISEENIKMFSIGVDIYKQYSKHYKKNP